VALHQAVKLRAAYAGVAGKSPQYLSVKDRQGLSGYFRSSLRPMLKNSSGL